MPDTAAALLSVSDLNAWYGESHILHGVEFEIPRGEVVTLLGRNGAGKTTTLKSVMGMVARRSGSIRFDGVETIAMPSDRIARLGLAFCPEERGIFASLNVHENLLLPPVVRPGGLTEQQVFELFPNLEERLRIRRGAAPGKGHQAPRVDEVDGGVGLARGGLHAAHVGFGIVDESFRQEEERLATAAGGKCVQPPAHGPEGELGAASAARVEVRRLIADHAFAGGARTKV